MAPLTHPSQKPPLPPPTHLKLRSQAKPPPLQPLLLPRIMPTVMVEEEREIVPQRAQIVLLSVLAVGFICRDPV